MPVILPDGTVLVVEGAATEPVCNHQGYDADAVLLAEQYDPIHGRWNKLAEAVVPRVYHAVALLLADGRVWTAGSNHNFGFGEQARELRIEVFEPPYFHLARPEITAHPAVITYSGEFEIETLQAGSIARLALIRCGTSTHGFNPDQRYVGLRILRRSGAHLTAAPPPTANIAPPGYYLLFAIDRDGVPSIGRFVRVVESEIESAQGRITFLRVHDVGTGFGPPSDFIDVEVVIALDTLPGRGFGFQLRADSEESVEHGMLDLLRDAFNRNSLVTIDYIWTGLRNSRILRVADLP
jgi:hypothetical protein